MNEQEIAERLSQGLPVEFPPASSNETQMQRAARTIRAELLEQLISTNMTVPVPVRISNAVVQGNLSWANVTFECPLEIRAEFTPAAESTEQKVDLSFAYCKRGLRFRGSAFQEFNANGLPY